MAYLHYVVGCSLVMLLCVQQSKWVTFNVDLNSPGEPCVFILVRHCRQMHLFSRLLVKSSEIRVFDLPLPLLSFHVPARFWASVIWRIAVLALMEYNKQIGIATFDIISKILTKIRIIRQISADAHALFVCPLINTVAERRCGDFVNTLAGNRYLNVLLCQELAHYTGCVQC